MIKNSSLPPVRLISGWSPLTVKANCILVLLALGASQLFAQTVYIQSRTSTGITANPPYQEVAGNWANSGSGSTADPTTGLGSRFGTVSTCSIRLTPTLASGNTYSFDTTHISGNASPNLVMSVTYSGCTGTASTTTAFNSSVNNTWANIGSITVNSGVTQPTITLTYVSGTLGGTGGRIYSDAFRFVNQGDPCLAGLSQLTAVNGPLAAGQTYVDVPAVSASATALTVYANGAAIGSRTSGIVAGVNRVTTTALVKGRQIIATQTNSAGVESCKAPSGPIVGGGANPRVRVVISLRQDTGLTGPIGTFASSASSKIVYIGSAGIVGGFGTAFSGGNVIQPNGCWQTLSFTNGVSPAYAWNGSDGINAVAGTFAILDSIDFAIDDLTDTGPFAVYIDSVRNGATVLQDFDSSVQGATVMFSQPSLSSTTTPFLLAPSPGSVSPNVSAVTNVNADSGTNSLFVSWQFKDLQNVDWLRLATQVGGSSNPEVDLSQPISFRMLVLPVGQTTASSPVAISAQPASQIAHTNGNVMLSVSATGTGTLVYQWYKNGVAIPSANSSTYNIPSAQASDVASYTVTISGDPPSCAATSQAAVVGLVSGPGVTVRDNRLMTLSVVTPAAVAATFQWSKSTDNGANYTPIAGATNTTYSQFVDFSDDGTLFRVTVNLPSGSAQGTTILHLDPGVYPPVLISAGAYDPFHIGIVYDERMDFQDHVGGAGDAGYYILRDDSGAPYTFGALVPRTNTFISDYGQSAVLVTDTAIPPGHYTLYAYDFADLAGNESGYGIDPSTGVVDFNSQSLTPVDVGIAGTNGAGVYNGAAIPIAMLAVNPFSSTNGGLDVVANGWDIWNGNDGFHFDIARPISGNFDVKVRVQTFVGADQWSKAGLMVRVSTNANSRFVNMIVTPATTPVTTQTANNFFSFQWRDFDGAGAAPNLGNINGVPPVTYPNAWVRLQRLGSVFYGYQSTNNPPESGTGWVLVGSRDTALSPTGVLPDTLLLGLSTACHDQVGINGAANVDGLSRNAYAEYRDLNIPNPPTITVQPSPLVLTQSVNTALSYSVTATNPANSGPLTYQWLKNGVPIPNATSATLSFASLAVTDTGIYSVDAANNGGAATSVLLSLTVTNVQPQIVAESMNITQGQSFTLSTSALLANDGDPDGDTLSILGISASPVAFSVTAATNFNLGNLAGASLYGNASILPTGGTANSGHLELTPAVNTQAGSMILNELTAGVPVYGFTANFNLRISGGTAEPADGFSFNFANNLLSTGAGDAAAEDGEGTGFSFCVDNYRFLPFVGAGTPKGPGASTTANSSGMKLVYHGTNIAGISMPTAWTNASYIPVSITVTLGGVVTVTVNGTNVFGNITLPGYVPTAGRFGLYARTGGLNETHWVDDLVITTLAPTATALGGSVTFNGVNATYTAPTNQCGSDTFYYLVSDGQSGGQAVDQVNITVYPGAAPTIVSCPTNRTVSLGANCLAALPDLTSQLVVTDTCCCVVIRQSPVPGTMSGLGTTVVTLTASNIAGFTATCQAIVTNADLTAPTITCPAANIVAECTGSGANVFYSVTAADNCDANPVVQCTPLASGALFPLGQTTVNCTATDASGNVSLCSFHVTVADTTPPLVTCANVTAECTGATGATATFTPTIVEACDPSPTNICTPPSGSLFALGPTPVHCASTDHSSNTGSCDFTVTVRDTIAPALVCPTNEVVECTGAGGAAATYLTPGAIDTCDASPTVSCTPASSSTFAVGTNMVTCITYDVSHNTNVCTFQIVVQDTVAPSITCVPAKTAECGTAWTFDEPSASDTCGAPVVTVDATVTNTVGHCGNTFNATRTWIATDASGNTASCSQTVTVVDTTPPNIVCAADKTVECGDAWTFNAPAALDDCGAAHIHNLGTVTNFLCGNTFTATRTWNATDDCGNTSTNCAQTVMVVDSTPPTIACVADKTVECGTAWTFDRPTAIKTCGTNEVHFALGNFRVEFSGSMVRGVNNPAMGYHDMTGFAAGTYHINAYSNSGGGSADCLIGDFGTFCFYGGGAPYDFQGDSDEFTWNGTRFVGVGTVVSTVTNTAAGIHLARRVLGTSSTTAATSVAIAAKPSPSSIRPRRPSFARPTKRWNVATPGRSMRPQPSTLVARPISTISAP